MNISMIQCRFFFLNAYKNISTQRPCTCTVCVPLWNYFHNNVHLLFRSECLYVHVHVHGRSMYGSCTCTCIVYSMQNIFGNSSTVMVTYLFFLTNVITCTVNNDY